MAGYGGTERVIWWLSKGLHELGIDVTLICKPGSQSPYANIQPIAGSENPEIVFPHADVYHHFVTPAHSPRRPYLVSIGGNGKPGETFLTNTVFVSRNHAERHGAEGFVYNGIDPDEYIYRDKKEDYLLFLAKASWRVKNVRGAIGYARATKTRLHILGGSRRIFNPWRGVHWQGMLGGRPKAEFLAGASALLWPILWEEPFGLAVVEAFVSGTPVIANRRGSVPELVVPQCGAICDSDADFENAIARRGSWRSTDCRDWAMSRFHYRQMAASYVKMYERVMKGEALNPRPPVTVGGE